VIAVREPHETRGASATDARAVIFGIPGDLARKMTFRSLYRLEQHGLLHCPIVGVALEDWSVERLRNRRKSVSRVPNKDARERPSANG
jgi:glucose-6-phosphate 1-dehydrogenase